MILRPQSLESFRPFKQYTYTPAQQYDMRKKIQNFTFLPSDKIGRGYSSIVYKGENDITKQSVAIKVIELKSLRDQNTKRFLQNQLECLRRLDHSNVLRYINSFMTSNNCYIITDLYNGGDLAKLLKQKIFFCESQIFEIFTQFYQGYLHFHSKGFIHRDIKPSNILIQKKVSEKPTYAIADFGFIKHLDQNPKDSFNVGTPVYMAPESITSNIYTIKSDIWSIGVMLFQMAYGFLPFQCKNEGDLRREICNKELRLQQIQENRQIFMSLEFKTLLLSCLRKNPQNRISLEEIGINPWFKKFSFTSYDLDLRIPKMNEPQYRRPGVSFSRQKINSSTGQNNYGYVGNQAIKRQKSLQSNNFALKNYQKNSVQFTRDSDISIDKHRQKARQLGFLSLKNNEKENQLKIKDPEPYFAQDYLKQKLNTNHRIDESPKMNFLMQKKNGIDGRFSLMEGVKGILHTKNSHILKMQNDSKSKNLQKRRQSYQKNDTFKTQMQTETSIQTKMDSAQSIESYQIKNLNFPTINSFQSLSPSTLDMNYVNNNSVTKIETSIEVSHNIENIASYANNNADKVNPVYDPVFTEQMVQESPKKHISPREFFLKSMHMLRFLFENLTVLSEYNGEKERLEDVKKTLEEFFAACFWRLKKSLMNKENAFELKKWNEFCDSNHYSTFVSVIEKYQTKYSQSTIIGQGIKNFTNERDAEYNINRYQALSYSILKLAQEISSANKQVPKKSIRSSSAFNSSISLIFNMHKCIEMAVTFLNARKDPNLLMGVNPEKDLEEMNSKSKDPFKIPKMVIQLKKKLITLESSTFTQSSQTIDTQNTSQAFSNVFRTGRVSIR